MLILSRFVDEVITIGDDIEIMVVAIGDGPNKKVRIGIQAPRDLEVHRKEIYEKIQRENSRR